MLSITVSELKAKTGHYVGLASTEDIIITKNGKRVAKLVTSKIDRLASMRSLYGLLPPDADLEKEREERLK